MRPYGTFQSPNVAPLSLLAVALGDSFGKIFEMGQSAGHRPTTNCPPLAPQNAPCPAKRGMREEAAGKTSETTC
jgi:hypothetical protein